VIKIDQNNLLLFRRKHLHTSTYSAITIIRCII